MSDFRISDSAAQTRAIEEFRFLDQEARHQAEKMAAEAAMKEIKEEEKDVDASEDSKEQRQADAEGGSGRREDEQRRKMKEEQKEPPPEVAEGHVLDLKA